MVILNTMQVFDIRDGDIFACVADIGWITGHSYVVYGPLVNGITTVLFESHPAYPDHGNISAMITSGTSKEIDWHDVL
ncbi:hypothetical protein QYM36_019909 [Artemia franciscana]|uniref:Uncharacterized protein n=1 Tax=Artemia franciscana TaxID=6661 RepID=A0AA88H0P4_ARTSF|nr:hypothetical protein QYM36_019909 [Artemia franciscana]